jgi:hypothetical protein
VEHPLENNEKNNERRRRLIESIPNIVPRIWASTRERNEYVELEMMKPMGCLHRESRTGLMWRDSMSIPLGLFIRCKVCQAALSLEANWY